MPTKRNETTADEPIERDIDEEATRAQEDEEELFEDMDVEDNEGEDNEGEDDEAGEALKP